MHKGISWQNEVMQEEINFWNMTDRQKIVGKKWELNKGANTHIHNVYYVCHILKNFLYSWILFNF